MTPKGFKAWVRKAARGRKIIYFEGRQIQENDKLLALRDVAMEAYEAGEVALVQKRMAPVAGINKRTEGTFAYVAIKL